MKKIMLFGILLFFVSFLKINAQGIKTYPIPSYNILSNGSSNFKEMVAKNILFQSRGHREVNVKNSGGQLCPIQIWVYSIDGQSILGPFTVNPDETIRIEIDEREWGVYSESECEAIISVWIEDSGTPTQAIHSESGETSCYSITNMIETE